MRLIDRLLISWVNAPEHPSKQRLLAYAIRLVGKRVEVNLEIGRFYVHPRDLIQRHLFSYGSFEPQTLKLVNFLLRGGGNFVDVGANIGVFSIAAAKMMGSCGHVLAIEPNPAVCAELLENRRLNKFESRITVVNAAVGNRRRLASFGVPPHSNQGTCREVGDGFSDRFYTYAHPLTEICAALSIDDIRLLKIDVEGSESLVLDGILNNGNLRPKHIIFEYLPDHFDYRLDGLEILGRLTHYGYELATVGGDVLDPGGLIAEGNIWAKLRGEK